MAMRLCEKSKRLQQTELMLCELSTQIRFCQKNLLLIFDEMKTQKQFENLVFLQNLNTLQCDDFEKIWQNSVYCDKKLDNAEKSALLPLGATLGSTDVPGQLAALEMARERFGAMICDAREKHPQKIRLYMSMGVLCGAMLAVLMI